MPKQLALDDGGASPPSLLAMMIHGHRLGNRELVLELQEQLAQEHRIKIGFLDPLPEWKGDFDYESED